MKIDIHITDATPEEAQRVLIGMSFAENILGKISPAIKIEKAQKPTPDPTCDEEAGCLGCKESALFDMGKCSECSPAPKPAKEKKTRANGPVKAGNHKGNKYGIPTELSKTNLKEYQRLWALCKAHDITYEQAKAWKRRPTRTLGEPHKNDPNASNGQQKIRELIAAKSGELRKGLRVRHNGLKASPLFGKEGTIRKIGDDGQVFVEFGESTTWLMPHSIAVIQEASS